MIREAKFTLSKGQFAIDMLSMAITEEAEPGLRPWVSVRAVWYRKKGGELRACYGYLRTIADRPAHPAEFLEAFDDGRYGGHCLGRWNGHGYWGAESPEVMNEHLLLLRPMIEEYPRIPPGYEGWYRFPTSAEVQAKRGIAQ